MPHGANSSRRRASGRTTWQLVDEFPDWTVYEWPEELREGRRHSERRLGQAQRWFTFRVRADDVEPTPDGVEFSTWRWVEPEWLIDQVVGFRQAVYRRVLGRDG